jgi:hypothetical protein
VPQTWTGFWTTLKKLGQKLYRNSVAKIGRDFNVARNIGEILLTFALPSIRVQGGQAQRRNREYSGDIKRIVRLPSKLVALIVSK